MIRKSKERTAIVEALWEAGEVPLTPHQIAASCGTKPNNVRVLLAKMLADDAVKKVSYGKYTLRGPVGIFSAASLARWFLGPVNR